MTDRRERLSRTLAVVAAVQSVAAGSGGPALVFATWNPADKGVTATLSEGNLRVDSIWTTGGVRSTISKSAGKWYWETTILSNTANAIGIALVGSVLNAPGQSGPESWGYRQTGNIYHLSAPHQTVASYTIGDVIGVALDLDANTLQFYKNGSAQGTPISITDTTWFAMYGAGPFGDFRGNAKTNFGASAFAFAPPGGYNAGLYL